MLATFLAYESRYWIPKTTSGFIKILREAMIFLLCETIMFTATIVLVNNLDIQQQIENAIENISKEPLQIVIYFGFLFYPTILVSIMNTVNHSMFIYHSIRPEVSQNHFFLIQCNFEHSIGFYLQTKEENAKKYSVTTRLIYSSLGCILTYGLMLLLLSPKMHTHIYVIFWIQINLWFFSEEIFLIFFHHIFTQN